MEESGSQGLDELLRKDKAFSSNIDYCCISDSSWLGTKKLCLSYGLGGNCYFFLEVECASKDLHSSVFGGAV
jgi:nonspecific dipeptidase